MCLHQSWQILNLFIFLSKISESPTHDFPILCDDHVIIVTTGNVFKFRQFLIQNIPK